MAESKQRRDYGSGSISQRADGTWTARMVIGVNEKGKPCIKALYGKVQPRNTQQRLAVDMLYNPDITINMIAGRFGSDKGMILCGSAC